MNSSVRRVESARVGQRRRRQITGERDRAADRSRRPNSPRWSRSHRSGSPHRRTWALPRRSTAPQCRSAVWPAPDLWTRLAPLHERLQSSFPLRRRRAIRIAVEAVMIAVTNCMIWVAIVKIVDIYHSRVRSCAGLRVTVPWHVPLRLVCQTGSRGKRASVQVKLDDLAEMSKARQTSKHGSMVL